MENHFSSRQVFWLPKAGNKGPLEFLNHYCFDTNSTEINGRSNFLRF